MSTSFDRMTPEALNLWYEQNVGYRPQQDDPTMTDDQLRELCRSYEEEVRSTSKEERPMKCRWFALCDNEAVRERPHPILKMVPICKRCDEKLKCIEEKK